MTILYLRYRKRVKPISTGCLWTYNPPKSMKKTNLTNYFQSHVSFVTEKAHSLFAILQSVGKLFAIYFFEEAADMVHDSEIKTVADKLVQAHYQNDRRMEKAKIFFSADDHFGSGNTISHCIFGNFHNRNFLGRLFQKRGFGTVAIYS